MDEWGPPIGIMGAMPEEVSGLVDKMEERRTQRIAMRDYHIGKLEGIPVVLAFSGWGKVASALSAAVLLQHFAVSRLWFSGIAGSLQPHVRIGDVVIAHSLTQHDMDCRPIMPRFQIPMLGMDRFPVDSRVAGWAEDFATAWLGGPDWARRIPASIRKEAGMDQPRVHTGLIASGDRFVGRDADRRALQEALPDALCVEMEGAAVAQVAHQFGVPLSVFRTISDEADSVAHLDFARFLAEVESTYSEEMIRALLRRISQPES